VRDEFGQDAEKTGLTAGENVRLEILMDKDSAGE
jgi:hypothetical protein